MSKRLITKESREPLLEGLAIFGTGGGGSPEFGKAIMENDFKLGREYTVVDPEDVEDDSFIISGGIMGSVKVVDTASVEDIVANWEEKFELLEALEITQDFFGKKVDYIVPFELGGLNTPVILSLGARANIPVINGDALGRAAPETHMTSFLGHGVSLTPMPLVDSEGNVIIVKESITNTFPDEIGRWVIPRGGGMGANNHYPMDGKTLKTCVIPNTISQALTLGEGMIKAREKGQSVIDIILEQVDGHLLLSNEVVEKIEEEDKGGFLHKVVTVGDESSKNHKIELVIKNEVMLCKINGEPVCIFPDLTLIVKSQSGRGLMSSELKEGTKLSIILAPCHKRLRKAATSPRGRTAFNPTRFGLKGLLYTPMEELIKERSNE